jgi:hypothetical protein
MKRKMKHKLVLLVLNLNPGFVHDDSPTPFNH